jgi:ApaG protein
MYLFLLIVFLILEISQSFTSSVSLRRSFVRKLDILESKESSDHESADRKDLWLKISNLERQAVDLLANANGEDQNRNKKDKLEALKLFAESISLKRHDPFLQLASSYWIALEEDEDTTEAEKLLKEMEDIGLPPHIAALVSSRKVQKEKQEQDEISSISVVDKDSPYSLGEREVVDLSTTFSDTVTEKIRVKVTSFFDHSKSDPTNGKYMFWYKVGIYNEGAEAVQVVARTWEIEKCRGEKEVVRGAGIMSSQPIIAPGDVFTYQSICPLKVFPAKGQRVLGSMAGAYTMCKGTMGQTNFPVKVGKFNLILPESLD